MSRTTDVARTGEMYALYQQGKTCYQIALAFKVSRQSVWERFKTQGLKLRPCPRNLALPFVEFDGKRYAPGKDNYFRKTEGDRELLHHAKWRKAHGRIKRGWVVKFVDGDRMNVDLDNLESVPREEMHTPRPITMKPCISCGHLMGRRATGNTPESPAAYAKRKTCSTQCSANWKKGRPKGTKMPGTRA